MMTKKYLPAIVSIVIIGLMTILAFKKHHKSDIYSYRSVIWADRAGYNVYLPATFIYDFDAKLFPDSIEKMTGLGFVLNRESGKVITKYTYGVALFELPFFLTAHTIAPLLGMERSGYSPIYYRVLYFSAVLFGFLGMLFLYKFLRFSYRKSTALISVAALFLGTNLYYYTIEESGMSHVYSFFLFSVFLYLIKKTSFLQKADTKRIFLLGLVAALIVLIRPTNILFLLIYFVLDISSVKRIGERFKTLLKPKTLLALIVAVVIIWLPQFIYWKYTSGDYLFDSYQGETFSWLHPKLQYTWFSPKNGLFLYAPFYFVLLFGAVLMAIKKNATGLYLIILFVLLSYIFSCWWDWAFGCSYGARSFVEFLAVFSIPLCYLIESTDGKKLLRFAFFGIILFLIGLNLKMTYSFDMCYFGEGDWDWNWYLHLISYPAK